MGLDHQEKVKVQGVRGVALYHVQPPLYSSNRQDFLV